MGLTSRTFHIDSTPIPRSYGRGRPDYRNGQIESDSRFNGRERRRAEWQEMLAIKQAEGLFPRANSLADMGERFFWTYTPEEIKAHDYSNLDISL